MSKDFLRRLPLFRDLSEEDLDRLYEMAESMSIRPGQLLMEEGEPGDALYVVLEGMFQVTKRSGKQEIIIASCKPGEVVGEMSLLEQAPRSASIRALTDNRLLKISHDSFDHLLARSPSAARSMLHMVMARLRNTESALRQSEKMAGLGTLAAGLAHELNNPAAAVRRSTEQLRAALSEWQRCNAEIDRMALEPDKLAAVNRLREETMARAASPASLDALVRSDRVSELQEWLEEHGVDEAWEVAPALVGLGWEANELDSLARQFPSGDLPVILRWIANGSALYTLLDEIGMSAQRISEIVKAVKTYSYLDQAPVQEVDIHEGLENTLVILRHKLKHGITVKREYAASLPRIEAYASELNQVWTNIIDNAIDAMKGSGGIVLRTSSQDDHVLVEICDNGPGIPPEIQSRIFEPFFTTKPPGVGTGLGLHITYNIVANKHHGTVHVESQPGQTCFQVSLPMQLKEVSRG